MTDQEKRGLRHSIKTARDNTFDIVTYLDKKISELCHTFTEDELLSMGWVKGSFNAAHVAYEYKKGKKTIIFKPEHNMLHSYWESPQRWFEDIQDLNEWVAS